MRIYLDNCCFNRPFDDQSQLRIRLESEAKLQIQEDIRSGVYKLIWSYILDYENSKNPFREGMIRLQNGVHTLKKIFKMAKKWSRLQPSSINRVLKR